MSSPRTPIPSLVNISINDVDSERSLKDEQDSFNFGSATPGTMARTVAFPSPLGMFSLEEKNKAIFSFEADAGNDAGSEATSHSERIGISRPVYTGDQHDNGSTAHASTASHRIGIQRPDYSRSTDDDLPLTSMELYLQKANEPFPPTMQHTSEDSSESDAQHHIPIPLVSVSTPTRDVMTMLRSNENHHEQPFDGIDRLVHKETSEGRFLINSPAMDAPMDGMRFCLKKGKKAMPAEMKTAAKKCFRETPKTKPRPSVAVASDSDSSQDQFGASFKVFLLLLLPKNKIFELIQCVYSPSQTTVGNLLQMIPQNATEPALGSQKYSGLCRPKDGKEISVDLMASASENGVGCARITRGEILVAIPEGYSGEQCARVAKPILATRAVAKLLKRADPLAPKRSKRRKSKSDPAKTKTKAKAKATDFEPFTMKDDSSLSNSSLSNSSMSSLLSKASLDSIQEDRVAYKHAIAIATRATAASNTSVDNVLDNRSTDCDSSLQYSSSFSSFSSFSSLASLPQCSFDANADVPKKRMPRRKVNRKVRRGLQPRVIVNVGACSLAVMVGAYLMDDSRHDTINPRFEPLGFFGIMQIMVCFLVLFNIQQYCQRKGKPSIGIHSPMKSKWS